MNLDDLDDPDPPEAPRELLHAMQRARRSRRQAIALAACFLAVGLVVVVVVADDAPPTSELSVGPPSTAPETTRRSTTTTTIPRAGPPVVGWVPDGFVSVPSLRTSGGDDDDVVGWSSPERGVLTVFVEPETVTRPLTDATVIDGRAGRSYEIGMGLDGRRHLVWSTGGGDRVVVAASGLDDAELVRVLDSTSIDVE